jgi:hypothetical protein
MAPCRRTPTPVRSARPLVSSSADAARRPPRRTSAGVSGTLPSSSLGGLPRRIVHQSLVRDDVDAIRVLSVSLMSP